MTYSREWVEWLLPGVWDSMRVMNAPGLYGQPDKDMPIPATDPRRTLDRVLGLADVQSAYARAGLSQREKQVLLMRYGFDLYYHEIGLVLNIDRSTASIAEGRGMDKILNYLGVDTCKSVTVDWMQDLNEGGQDD